MTFLKNFLWTAAFGAAVATSNIAAAEEFDWKSQSFDDMEAIKKASNQQGKPAVVFATQPWCGACKRLKSDMNKEGSFKKMVENKEVIATVVEGDGNNKWQAPGESDGYVPRVYFINNEGKMITSLKGPNSQYARFFPNGESVLNALNQMMDADADIEL